METVCIHAMTLMRAVYDGTPPWDVVVLSQPTAPCLGIFHGVRDVMISRILTPKYHGTLSSHLHYNRCRVVLPRCRAVIYLGTWFANSCKMAFQPVLPNQCQASPALQRSRRNVCTSYNSQNQSTSSFGGSPSQFELRTQPRQ